jgi:hypothetical protein
MVRSHPMHLSGVEVPFETLFNLKSNTILAIISDDKGMVRLVQVDHQSIKPPKSKKGGTVILKVTPYAAENPMQLTFSNNKLQEDGCYVAFGSSLEFRSPCPE